MCKPKAGQNTQQPLIFQCIWLEPFINDVILLPNPLTQKGPISLFLMSYATQIQVAHKTGEFLFPKLGELVKF